MNHRQSRQKKELERTALAALGLVSERYAGVSNIEFLMTYYPCGNKSSKCFEQKSPRTAKKRLKH